MIYTTYFANLKKIPEGVVPIAISRTVPEWYTGKRCPELAPSSAILREYKETGDHMKMFEDYLSKVLEGVDPNEVSEDLYTLAGATDIALVCYEKASDPCHRHALSVWFNSQGVPCVEWSTYNMEQVNKLFDEGKSVEEVCQALLCL